eukprot:CAMPEP_0170497370 /NCGR_PEP_ID=MMETSP0208-20121228/24611_1 /TAXON_ID=197538 /ORGANISM="Strombidium inclinatum, Strain S3" /LENGTH=95 /DNA_ID=CAMNT_0010774169 /DNA_START=929 /DNA_END=1216 /DNA_ORIENTATION=-
MLQNYTDPDAPHPITARGDEDDSQIIHERDSEDSEYEGGEVEEVLATENEDDNGKPLGATAHSMILAARGPHGYTKPEQSKFVLGTGRSSLFSER